MFNVVWPLAQVRVTLGLVILIVSDKHGMHSTRDLTYLLSFDKLSNDHLGMSHCLQLERKPPPTSKEAAVYSGIARYAMSDILFSKKRQKASGSKKNKCLSYNFMFFFSYLGLSADFS